MTAPRVFISYRSSDGADKATALARDLGERFGDGPIFLDKDDLGAGVPWRQEIAQALDARPIVLVLVTPDLLGALDAQGARRIDAADDPVRAEVAAAEAAGAHIIPLLCDGLESPPSDADLPPPLRTLTERTWRRLRAYDWAHDLERLAGDLQALGLVPLQAAPPASAAARARRPWLLAAGAAVLAAAAGGAWWWQRPPPAPAFAGRWRAQVGRRGAERADDGTTWTLQIVQDGLQLRLTTEPVNVAGDTDWDDYRRFWRENQGSELQQVVWRGEGEAHADPGQAPWIDLAMRCEAPVTAVPIDGGNLRASRLADGSLQGRLWVNGEQGERLVLLRRA